MKRRNLRTALWALALTLTALPAMAQRVVDKIDRGLVAVPSTSSGNLVQWRVFGEEYYDVTYNLYANGSLLKSGITTGNYLHTAGTASTTYQVAAVVRGEEQELSESVTRLTNTDSNGNAYFKVPVQEITSRDGTETDITTYYTINDISLGDLDGDGVCEFIVKRPCSVASDVTQSNYFHVLDCYKLDGTRLWWIDMGPNMLSGADEQWDCVCYDWDQDGKAEVILRGADDMVIHYADGTTETIGTAGVDTRWDGIEYTSTGNEYLLYLEGETGKPYQVMTYPIARGTDTDWGSGIVGHRSTKHYFAAPYLDGCKPSIFLGRGCYTKHVFKAYDVDASSHELSLRWEWECTNSSSPWYGQGYHNFAIADVDWDGRDEIMFGSMTIDDNGYGLSTSGLGHGDAQHCADFDPYRHGQEQFACNESSPNMNYRDATTSTLYYRSVGTSDDGRALMANFSDDYPGSQGRSVNTGWVSSVNDKVNSNLDLMDWSALNQRIYWDADLCDEYFNSPGSNRRNGVVYKAGTGSRLAQFSDSQCNNSSKNNPCAIADIFGDWREEVIMSCGSDTYFAIFVTPYYTTYRIPTLWHDHQYRNAMVWQSMGYNQPPHKSYFLGEMEGITVAPPPLIMTDRTEVANGGTITTTDDHLIVCETNNTNISIASGASPYMVTFNVPSWVQGSGASNTTTQYPDITYDYYTCTVTGGPLTGSTRVVKQGDGILTLPAVDMTYTGETNVWAGTLNFDGTLKNSPLWLNRFAELNSNGGTFRKITADYASIIRPGGEDNCGSITTDTLELNFGSRVQLDLYSDGIVADQINASILSIESKADDNVWVSYGPEYLVPVIEVIPHTLDGETLLAEGDYVLGSVDTVDGDISNIKIEGVSGQKKSLSVVDGKLVLSIAGIRDATTIYWTGSEGSAWDYASTLNFDNEGTVDYFVSGDDVIFDDAATSYTVSVNEDIDPTSVTVNSSTAYTFSGTGDLTGDMTFTKDGTSTLTMSGDNSYTGQTTISGGTVKVSSLSNENLAKGNLGAVTTSPLIIENGAILQTTADVTMGTPITVQTDEGGVINNSSTFNMNATIKGTLLTKKGSGTMNLYTANSSLTQLTIAAGTVTTSVAVPAKTIELQGGTFTDNAQAITPAIYVAKSKKGTWYLTGTYYTHYTNTITGEGTLTIIPTNTVSRVSLKIDASEFYGTIKHTTTDIWLPLNTSTAMSHATLDIASGCTVTNVANTLKIGAVTGSGTLAQPVSNFSSQTTQTGTNTWQIGNSDDNDFTFAGTISDDPDNSRYCAFTKIGTCKMTFTGTGTFARAARVNAGELVLNNSGSTTMLGTSTLNVASGGTLSGKGVLGNSTVTIAKGGTLRSGITTTSTTGNLQFSSKNVTVNGNMQTYIGSRTTYSKFTDIGTLKLNGTLTVAGRDGLALSEGDEFQIIDASTITLGDDLVLDLCEPNESMGLTWDTSRLSEGVLVVGPAPTAIQSISADLSDKDIYTLSGVKLQSTPKRAGVYIVDGVKTLIK